jgi:conjugal transfer pilus assembly protein TraD
LNKGRGAKIRLFIATQTFADFAARTGSQDKARQVLGNVNNLIALRIMDSETQQYITDNLPKTRLKYIMRTQGVATSATHRAFFPAMSVNT